MLGLLEHLDFLFLLLAIATDRARRELVESKIVRNMTKHWTSTKEMVLSSYLKN
jgi:hypothetical protein